MAIVDLGAPFEKLSQQEKVDRVFRNGRLLRTEMKEGVVVALFHVHDQRIRVFYPANEWDDTRFEVVS